MTENNISGYQWDDGELTHAHSFILPVLDKILTSLATEKNADKRIFDLGCGNGSTANYLSKKGYDVTGVDPSEKGIQQAKESYPHLKLFNGSAYDYLSKEYGQFPLVLSLEVVEHVYAPRDYAKTLYNLTSEGGSHSVNSLS